MLALDSQATPQRTETATADVAIAKNPSWCGDFLSLMMPIATREMTQAPVGDFASAGADTEEAHDGKSPLTQASTADPFALERPRDCQRKKDQQTSRRR